MVLLAFDDWKNNHLIYAPLEEAGQTMRVIMKSSGVISLFALLLVGVRESGYRSWRGEDALMFVHNTRLWISCPNTTTPNTHSHPVRVMLTLITAQPPSYVDSDLTRTICSNTALPHAEYDNTWEMRHQEVAQEVNYNGAMETKWLQACCPISHQICQTDHICITTHPFLWEMFE